jgi:lipoprotein-releasing system permease protein
VDRKIKNLNGCPSAICDLIVSVFQKEAALNFEYFLARRLTFSHQRAASGLVVRLAVISIAVAVATIEIALSFVEGFETEIQNKVIGFGSHIQVGNYYRSADTEVTPIDRNEPSIEEVKSLSYVVSVSPYVERPALFKSEIGWDGALLKGIDSTYHWDFFRSTLKEGEIPDYGTETTNREILISRKQADNLDLQVGDRPYLVFFTNTILPRRVTVAGIYETGMEEFDNTIVLCDMRLLQQIWRWDPDQVSGFEVNLSSLDMLDSAAFHINEITPYTFGAEPITHIFPEIFDWLRLQHQNVDVILALMILVGIINMTTVLLILIIERTRTIGILKALGLPSFRIQRMFVWNAFFLIGIGTLVGNALGLGLLASQDWLGWVKVNQADYFIETVPVAWVWGRFLYANFLVIACCTIFMIVPALVINRITPVKAIRMD